MTWAGKHQGPELLNKAAASATNSPASKTRHSPSAARLTAAGPLPEENPEPKGGGRPFH